jgi:hypothetical protein
MMMITIVDKVMVDLIVQRVISDFMIMMTGDHWTIKLTWILIKTEIQGLGNLMMITIVVEVMVDLVVQRVIRMIAVTGDHRSVV